MLAFSSHIFYLYFTTTKDSCLSFHVIAWTTGFYIHTTQRKVQNHPTSACVCVCMLCPYGMFKCLLAFSHVWTGSKFLLHTLCGKQRIWESDSNTPLCLFMLQQILSSLFPFPLTWHQDEFSLGVSDGFINTPAVITWHVWKSASSMRCSFTPPKFHPLSFPRTHRSSLSQASWGITSRWWRGNLKVSDILFFSCWTQSNYNVIHHFYYT